MLTSDGHFLKEVGLIIRDVKATQELAHNG